MMAELRSVREAYGSCAGEIMRTSLSCSGRFGLGFRQGVDALFVMHFLTRQRRVEDADDAQRLFAAAQPVLVVVVQGVDHAGAQVVLLAVGDGLDGAVAFNAHTASRWFL
ncbi:hypothetical protein G6F57_023271 [Rhizopus arrhizus]|nr:hypothetical protein G6F57_023271 [Rhizopus arrhizus]